MSGFLYEYLTRAPESYLPTDPPNIGPGEATFFYATDTGNLWTWNDSEWIKVGGSGGGGALNAILFQSDLQNIYSTPKLLIDNPGSGKTIIVNTVIFMFYYGGTPYAAVDVPNLYLFDTVGAIKWDCDASALKTLLEGTTDEVLSFHPLIPTGISPTDVQNKSLWFTDTADYTDGDGALRIFISYDIA